MLDTIALSHILVHQPDAKGLIDLGWQARFDSRDKSCRAFIHNEKKGSLAPRLTISRNPISEWHLRAEVSLPAWLQGSNVKLLDEKGFQAGLRLLSEYVTEKSNIRFDVESAQTCRVDFARDYYIGEALIIPTIDTIARMHLPHTNRWKVNDSTVYFVNRGKLITKKTRVYGKYIEVVARKRNLEDQKNASGQLRLEVSLLKPQAINQLKDKLNLPCRSPKNILTSQTADFVLNEVEQLLNLNSIIQVQENKIEKLLNTFAGTRAKNLAGFLQFYETFGADFYKLPFCKISRSVYYRDLADCRQAGILL